MTEASRYSEEGTSAPRPSTVDGGYLPFHAVSQRVAAAPRATTARFATVAETRGLLPRTQVSFAVRAAPTLNGRIDELTKAILKILLMLTTVVNSGAWTWVWGTLRVG